MKKSDNSLATSSKIKFDESREHESSSEDEEEIERELAEVTFEELLKARSNGSHSIYRKPNSEKKAGRANKNRPMEVSSKQPVSRFREVIQVPKRVVRDPRFESLCGKLDVEGFKKRYNFQYENDLPAEREELKKLMKKSNDPKVINDLENRIAWIVSACVIGRQLQCLSDHFKFLSSHSFHLEIFGVSASVSLIKFLFVTCKNKQLKSASTKRTDNEILAEHKKKERAAAKKGKQPFYIKKSEIRKQRLIEKYEDLKASGKLESFVEKRRRKNAAKDHRYMPYRRSNNNEQDL